MPNETKGSGKRKRRSISLPKLAARITEFQEDTGITDDDTVGVLKEKMKDVYFKEQAGG